MKYLLDTHVLLWYFEDSPKLPESVAAIIEFEGGMIEITLLDLSGGGASRTPLPTRARGREWSPA
ncbi:MAG: hypothetical protein LBK56_05395 [Gracilibacteraceae bacterium]|jgi:hypothetical protein|nr:hypothetical protein [Gracilibacteraceae bacterium]